jgi:hypothetical protein
MARQITWMMIYAQLISSSSFLRLLINPMMCHLRQKLTTIHSEINHIKIGRIVVTLAEVNKNPKRNNIKEQIDNLNLQ